MKKVETVYTHDEWKKIHRKELLDKLVDFIIKKATPKIIEILEWILIAILVIGFVGMIFLHWIAIGY